jgi:cytochrome d ubiquinol oxidase subunit I
MLPAAIMDIVLLARLQFALTIMFHYLFPPLSIGLGALMVVMEALHLRRNDPHYEAMARFFTRLFAANFAVGVATGIVMEFQFGTNWSRYSRFVGDVFGSALAAEGIFAFFLESGFLAILVFGWDRVSKRMHFFATCMVALGATFSSVWIVVANSFQQTPAGHRIVPFGDGMRAEIVDFWAMVFNPSSVVRLVHVVFGAYVLGAFFVLSILCFYALRGRHPEIVRRGVRVALVFGLAASACEVVAGSFSADVVARHQPAKLAAFEGHFHTGEGGTPFYLFGVPDADEERVKAGVAVPGMLSFLVHRDFHTPVAGLDRVPKEDRPPVVLPFLTYHVMIATGLAMVGLLALGLLFDLRGKLTQTPWLLKSFVVAVALPYIANQAGWVSAEVGRQPWVVYGLLRTKDATSPHVPASQVLASIVGFGVVYVLLFAVWVFVLDGKIKHGPDEPSDAGKPPPESLLEAAAARPAHADGLVDLAARPGAAHGEA